MNIHNNFDRWMFDYMEGNLSSGEIEEFEQFLAQNPNLEPDADAWQNSVIPTENINYPHQQALERKKKFIGWYGWSAAALLLAGLLFAGQVMLNSSTSPKWALNKEMVTDQQRFLTAIPENEEIQEIGYESVESASVTDSEARNYTGNAGSVVRSSNNGVTLHANEQLSGDVSGNQSPESSLANTNSLMRMSETKGEVDGDDMGDKIHKAVHQELGKIEGGKNIAAYQHNPDFSMEKIDLTSRSNVNMDAFSYKMKRVFRKIERMLGYPVGLTNLRDPQLVLPENQITKFNPGFTGGLLKSRFEMSSRSQWLGTEMAMQTSRIAFDTYRNDIRGGIGVSIDASTAHSGAFGQYSINLTYSPKINLGDNLVLEPGVRFSMGVIDGRNEQFGDLTSFELERGLVLSKPIDYSVGSNQLWYKDWGAGFVLNAKQMYLGFSADNLGGHYASVYPLEGTFQPVESPVRYTAILGLDFLENSRDKSFSPFISGRHFGDNFEGWGGFSARLNHFTFGASYSTGNDYVATAGLHFKHFNLIYQYDMTTSYALEQQVGSHSLGIRITGGRNKVRLNN